MHVMDKTEVSKDIKTWSFLFIFNKKNKKNHPNMQKVVIKWSFLKKTLINSGHSLSTVFNMLGVT